MTIAMCQPLLSAGWSQGRGTIILALSSKLTLNLKQTYINLKQLKAINKLKSKSSDNTLNPNSVHKVLRTLFRNSYNVPTINFHKSKWLEHT